MANKFNPDPINFQDGAGGILEECIDALAWCIAVIFAFVVSFLAIAGTGIGAGFYWHSRIACALVAAFAMGVIGLVADYRSGGHLHLLPFNKPVGYGVVSGFVFAIIFVNYWF